MEQQADKVEDDEYERLKKQYLDRKSVQDKDNGADDYETLKKQYLNRQSKNAES